MAVNPASAPPLWEAQMLCWLASGEHEALEKDMKRTRILIPTQGKLTIPLQIRRGLWPQGATVN